MTKVLVIGDLHTKLSQLYTIEPLFPQYDKVIFLGDYVDDWDTLPLSSTRLVEYLVSLKQSDLDKYILLLGNHDASAAFAGSFRCSGFNEETRLFTKSLFRKLDENGQPLFQFSYAIGQYLFTHAGLTSTFWDNINYGIRNRYPQLKEYLKPRKTPKQLSLIFNKILAIGLEDQTDFLFQKFSQVGKARGGIANPSILWADKSELIADPFPRIRQVVGHTPVETIIQRPKPRHREPQASLIFCDTMSSYYDPYTSWTFPIGDGSLLEMTFNDYNRAKTKIIHHGQNTDKTLY